MYPWLEHGYWLPEGFRPYRGPYLRVYDSYTKQNVNILPGTHWWHGQDRIFLDEPDPGQEGCGDPGVVIAILECQGDICVWWHRVKDTVMWQIRPEPGNRPWCLDDFTRDMRPSPQHPKNWSVPTVWDRLLV